MHNMNFHFLDVNEKDTEQFRVNGNLKYESLRDGNAPFLQSLPKYSCHDGGEE